MLFRSYHNLPTVCGVDQKDGWKFHADSFSAEEGKVAISFKSAYPEESGLCDLERTLIFDNDVLILTDRFAFTNGTGSVVEHLMTPYCPVINGNVVLLDGKYEIDCEGGTVSVDEVHFEGNRKLQSSWKSAVLYRINVDFGAKETVTLRTRRV